MYIELKINITDEQYMKINIMSAELKINITEYIIINAECTNNGI